MDTPLVTIVVISYNQAKYIVENLNSIKAQTYKNIELIVADDASSDNSVEVFDNWLTENNFLAKKNYHTKNTGLATVLNECIELATGKYIKLIAADDCLEIKYIEECLEVLLNNNADIVFTNAFEIDENSNILKSYYFKVPNFKTSLELEEQLIKDNFISGATMMTSLRLYKLINYYNSNTLLEDYNLVLQSLNKGIYIHYINKNLVRYRRHNNNITVIRFDKLEIETIKEKIFFDIKGIHNEIIHNDIRKQRKRNNIYLRDLKAVYYGYKGFSFKFLILNFYPFLSRLIKLRG